VTSKLIVLLSSACQMQSKIRPVTIELSINLLLQLQSTREPDALLDDKEFALLEQAKEESIMVARTFFKVISSQVLILLKLLSNHFYLT
jgi:CLEC16A C-terminal